MLSNANNILTLDWGSNSLKVVEGTIKERQFYLKKFVVKKSGDGLDSKHKQKVSSQELDLLFKKNSFSAVNLNLIVSGSNLITKILNVPLIESKALEQLVLWEVKDIVTVDLEELVIDYEIIAQHEKKMKVIVAIMYKERLLKQINALEKAGMKVDSVLPGPLLLKNLLSSELRQKRLAIIDIGAQETKLSIFKHGQLSLRRILAIGGTDFTLTIETKKNLSQRSAKQLKESNNCEIELIAEPVAKLIKKISLSIHYWEQQEEKLDCIFLTGGGAKLKGLDKFIKKNLEIEVKMLTGLSQFEFKQAEFSLHWLKEQLPYLSLSLSGALSQI